MRKQIILNCPVCHKEYSKNLSEHNRNIKKNRSSYCSINCSAKDTILTKIPMNIRKHDHLYKYAGVKLDQYSNFRYYLRSSIKKRKECTITLEYLKDLWNTQQGKCAYTNIDLIPKKFTSKSNKNDSTTPLIYASLDRIDSSKGYIPGNVEFICVGINFLKNKYTKQQTIDFLKLIVIA